MKLTTLLLLFSMISVNAKTFAQKITLSKKNAALVDVLNEIRSQSGYGFIFNSTTLKDAHRVTINVKELELKKVLDLIFADQILQYTIEDKSVIVSKRNKPNAIAEIQVISSDLNIGGTIKDTQGNLLHGARVQVKGSKIETATNKDGKFALTGVPEKAILIISYVGYKTKEITATENLSITLEIQISEIDEIEVSTGYQTLPKERVTGSFHTLGEKQFEQQRLSSLSSLLEGRVPGYNNGLIRGNSSLSTDAQSGPLYVVDGFPVENNTTDEYGIINGGIPGLNLEDIASITVLKDAAAASIYGARAANGVIVIITKKGTIGKPQISASSTFTANPYRYYTGNLATSADVVELEKEWAANNTNLQGTEASSYAQSLLDNVVYQSQGIKAILQNATGALSNTDLSAKLSNLSAAGFKYYDDVKKYSKVNPFYQQYNLNIGSATAGNSFYTSATYRKNQYEDKYTADDQLGLNVKNNAQLNKWLNLEISSYLNYVSGATQTYTTLSPGYQYQIYDSLIDDSGNYITNAASSRYNTDIISQLDANGMYSMDITALEEQAMNLTQKRNINSRSYIKLKADITNWLSYTPSFQYEYTGNRNEVLYDKSTYYVRNLVNSFASVDGSSATYNLPYGNINQTQTQFTNAYNFRQQLNIDKRFGDKHNITAILGSEIRHTKLEFDSKYQYNYDSQLLSSSAVDETLLSAFYDGILGYPSFNRGARAEVTSRFVSLYSNAGYSYDDKYLLTASLRLDRSNLWSTSSEYQDKPMWSIGAGWNVDRERFFDVRWINKLKVRGSYGISGNVDPTTSPFIVAAYWNNTNLGGLYAIINNRPNPLLTWERTATLNAGIDFKILNNRLGGSVDFYEKKGSDLLASTRGVDTEGYGSSTFKMNNGKMTNTGVEIALNGDILQSNSLNWNLGIQYAFNKNKVTYVDLTTTNASLQRDYSTAYPVVGNPYQAVYAYKWAGLSATGLPQVYEADGTVTTELPSTGEALEYAGTTVPKYSGGISSTLSYKAFTFAFLLTYEGGHVMRNTFLPMLSNSYNSSIGSYYTLFGNINSDITNRWKQAGDESKTNVPRAMFAEDADFVQASYDVYRYADINILDASNIRLRNISLAYAIADRWTKKIGIGNARLQFNVENAFILAKSKTAKYLLDGYNTPNYVLGLYLHL
ncbi:SusC/RagA family TonB-linked outer membrane protein [Sphingobacterium sp. LRF_L2]|uniref:SusC/RagA family TonB-linked outer membrane protein n=1 Tax=Sphingobacterium sp. LRF_L2 TaxID=3369421 RepID=UPI003F637B38